MRKRSKYRGAVLASAALGASLTLGALPALASGTEYRRGPDPTSAAQLETNGTFAYASYGLSNSQTPSTFGSATVHYPTSTAQGTFAGIAISPGWTENNSVIDWLGRRLASHGFVVILAEPNNPWANPTERKTALLGALDYLTGSSAVKSRVDATRTAVAGHSMGGGGALEALMQRPSLKAGLAMAPWDADVRNFTTVTSPALVIGLQSDTIAPIGDVKYSYSSIPTATAKAYAELVGRDHFYTNTDNAPTSRLAVAWMKRFADNDSRYQPFLCPAPVAPTAEFSDYQSTCGTAY